MNQNLFIIVLKYIGTLKEIDANKEKHLQFLDIHYNNKIFIASGPQIPRLGGIIIAKSKTKYYLEKILQNDPFAIKNIAEYHIYEFTPTRYTSDFELILKKVPLRIRDN